MGVIREFKQRDSGGSDFRQKLAVHRTKQLIKYILIGTIAFALVIFARVQYSNQIYTGITVTSETRRVSLDTSSYLNSNGSVIAYSKDGISKTDGTGKVLWNMTYEMQKPIVHQKGEIVAACDYNGHVIYLISSDGKVREIDTRLPIRDFCVSEEMMVAVILEENNTSRIDIFDENGNAIVDIKATMSKTGYPLALTLSHEVLGVSYCYVDGETMRSSVTFYNFGGVGENAADHIVSSYDYVNAVVPIISFMDNDNVYAVADNRLMFYSGAKKPVSSADIMLSENIIGVYNGGGNTALVFYDNTGEHKYRLDMYSRSGVKEYSYSFDQDYKDILVGRSQTCIYNESSCIVVNGNGREKFSGQFADSVISLSATESNKKYIAVTPEQIQTLVFN
ncbi:MAG: DUF5711 family protein [Lachnospiraceae bacterium]|nr:DUF5711 family protein [Lachnospiraceae bacterium]